MIETGLNISSNALPSERGNRVRVVLYSNSPNARTIFARVKQADRQGNIIFSTQQIPISAGEDQSVGQIILTDGYLLEVNVWDPNSYQVFCRVFGSVYFQQGDVFGQETAFPLITGFVGGGRPLIWPIMPSESNNDIKLEPKIETWPTPAAGGDATFTSDANEVVRIIGGQFVLTTGVAVANRTLYLDQETITLQFSRSFARTTIPASTQRTIELWRGPNLPTDSADRFFIPIPETGLLGTFIGVIGALQLQAADQISDVNIIMERHVVAEA